MSDTSLETSESASVSRESCWDRRLAKEAEIEAIAEGGFHDYDQWGLSLFLKWTALAGLQATGLYARGVANTRDWTLRKRALTFAALPKAFDGYRILHLSDLHFDGFPGFAEALARFLDPIEADLCVITGDFRFGSFDRINYVGPSMATVMEGIHAPDGILGTLGNHDSASLVESLEALGIRVLYNEHAVIRRESARIHIAGVDDHYKFHAADVPAALEGVPDGAFKALLSHTPQLFQEAETEGVHLYLCGHTHGGQICLPGSGALLLNAGKTPRRYCTDFWRHGAMEGHTSRGAGVTSVHVRYNCRPEAALLTLRHGE